MPNLDTVYFTSESEIKANFPVGDLVDAKYIQPAINATSDQIRQILRSKLAEKMRLMVYNAKVIASVTQASPGVLSMTANHGLSTGDTVGIINAQGMPDLNGSYQVTVLSPTTLSLEIVGETVNTPLDTTTYPVYSNGSAKLLMATKIEYGLIRLLQSYHSRWAIKEMLLHHSARIVNSGIAQVGGFGQGAGNDVKPIDPKSLGPLIDGWKSKIVTTETDILNYLCEYSSSFPEYTSGQNPIERTGPQRPRIIFT